MIATYLTRLALTEFRSYRWLELAPGPSSVLLLGPNGAGKTNILEAISLLGPGRGLRRAELGELRQMDAQEGRWGVNAIIQHGSSQHQLSTGRDAAAEAEKRIAQVDGATAPVGSLADFLPLSWLTPEMDRLLGGDKAERRRFYDRLVTSFDPAHSARLSRYDKQARERLTLLIKGGDDVWIATLETEMAQSAVAIAAARLALAEAINTRAPEIAGQFPVLRLSFASGPEAWLQTDDATTVEDRLRSAYHASRARDRRAETTGDGPSRSDLVATYVARRMPADLCSTGEQKALLITLLMTHAALVAQSRHQTPILLLDEVASHLDPQRRQALFTTLHSLGCQLWMTGTEQALFSGFPGVLSTYEIARGTAKKVLS